MTEPLTLHIELPEGAVQATTRKAYDAPLYFVDVQLPQRWPVSWKTVAETPSNLEARQMVQELNARIAVYRALTT